MKNKVFLALIILALFLFTSCVSAGENITDDAIVNETPVIDDLSESVNKTASFNVSDQKNYVKKTYFEVQLLDENSTPMSNRSVYFTLNNAVYRKTTDANGTAKLKLNVAKGTYKVKYTFNESGYRTATSSKKILIITTSAPTLKCTYSSAYEGFKNTYSVTLTLGGLALSKRAITFTVNGKTYTKKTDSNGKASITVKLAKGSYNLKYSYAGEENINSTSGTTKIKVVKGMPTSLKRANSIIYRHKTSAPFKIKLLDVFKNPIAAKNVKFTINGKTYTKKTNKKGIATLNIKLSKGSYTLKIKFSKNYYKTSSKSFTIKVKPKQARNNGLWILSTDMAKVNFTLLKSYGTKHIFLNAKAIERYGKTYVETFIKNAKSKGIKTHLWVRVFYKSGKWLNPIKNGKINYNLINSKIKEAKKFAKVKGIAGIHFDYLRFPGTAYKYAYGVKAINYFTKYATKAVHKISSKLIVSAAVMPEPFSMKYYYGQDISVMSKYLDVLVPMVYKGNYNAGTAWIKSVTQTFVKKSNGAKIWTGLQTYKSDSGATKLSAKSLMNDADAAALGGAYGVILFRFGLLNYINFNNV